MDLREKDLRLGKDMVESSRTDRNPKKSRRDLRRGKGVLLRNSQYRFTDEVRVI